MTQDSPKMLSVSDVAGLWKVSDQHIYNLVKAKKITHIRFGRMIRFRPQDLEDYLHTNRSELINSQGILVLREK